MSVQNKHYLNAGASAVISKEAILSGILQVLFKTIFLKPNLLYYKITPSLRLGVIACDF